MNKKVFQIFFLYLILMFPFLIRAEEWTPGGLKNSNPTGNTRRVPNIIYVQVRNGIENPEVAIHENVSITTTENETFNYSYLEAVPSADVVIGAAHDNSNPKDVLSFANSINESGWTTVGAVNASFFCPREEGCYETDKPNIPYGEVLGHSKIRGVEKAYEGGWNSFASLNFNGDLSKVIIDTGNSDASLNYRISGAYFLVKDGRKISSENEASRATGYYNIDNNRGHSHATIIGQKANGTYVFIVITGQPTVNEMLEICTKHNLANAVRMDGGGSSELAFDQNLESKELNEPAENVKAPSSSTETSLSEAPRIVGTSDANIMNLEGTTQETAYNFALRSTAQETELKASESENLFERVLRFVTNAPAEQGIWQLGSSNEIISEEGNSLSEGSIEVFNFECTPNGECTPQTTSHEEVTLSGAEISVKAAAMKLQNLQKKYDYNIMMVLQAYNFGETAMDKLLELYEEQTGITVEDAIKDNKNTSWANYAAEICVNPTRYGFGSGEGSYNEETGEVSCVWGDYKYVEHVLSRDISGGYVYTYLPEEESTRGYQEGTWLSSYGLTDNETANARNLQSGSTDSGLVRAYSTWSGMDESERSNLWTLMTMGQKTYKSGMNETYNTPEVVHSENPSKAIYLNSNEYSQNDKEGMIKDLFIYGTNLTRDEISVERDEVWQARFGNVFGGGQESNGITASLKYTTYFEENSVLQEPVANYEEIVQPFGYDKSGFYKAFNQATIYGGVGKLEDNITTSPFEPNAVLPIKDGGKVTSISERTDGYTVTIDYGEYNGYHIESIYYYLEDVLVSEGDELKLTDIIGYPNEEEAIVGHELLVNGTSTNYEEIYANFRKKAIQKGFTRLKEMGFSLKDWVGIIGEINFGDAVAASLRYGGFGSGGCVNFINAFLDTEYAGMGYTARGKGNGIDVAGNLAREPGWSNAVCAGGIWSTAVSSDRYPGYGHVGVVTGYDGTNITVMHGGCRGIAGNSISGSTYNGICVATYTMEAFQAVYGYGLTFACPPVMQ